MPTYVCPACGHSPMGMGEQFGDEVKGYIIVQCCRKVVHSWDYTEEGVAKTEADAEALRIAQEKQAAAIAREEEINEKRRHNLELARAAYARRRDRLAAAQAETEEKGEDS